MDQTTDGQLLQLILAEAPIGIYTINKDGIIDSFNPEMVKLAGAKAASDVIGLNALALPTYQEVGLTEYFKRGLLGEPFFLPAVKYTSFTGVKTSYRLYKGVPVKDGSGGVVKLLLFVLDITQKVEIEEAEKRRERFEAEMLEHDKELEKMNKLMVDRELRMIELKKENQELKERLGKLQQ